MKTFSVAALAGLMLGMATAAMAGPVYTFSVSEGTQPFNVGVITLTQNGTSAVDVSVDLLPSGAGAIYGFINTGGPHTPFAFNLAGSGALSISPFTTPPGGVYASGIFSLNISGGDNTPYGSFGIALDSTADNGSGAGYFGDLLFTLNRVGGLDTSDFVTNGDGWYFSADLSDGANTGAQAWKVRDGGCPVDTFCGHVDTVPEPGTLSLFGLALAGLGAMRRRKTQRPR